jgi:hypothetical protein
LHVTGTTLTGTTEARLARESKDIYARKGGPALFALRRHPDLFADWAKRAGRAAVKTTCSSLLCASQLQSHLPLPAEQVKQTVEQVAAADLVVLVVDHDAIDFDLLSGAPVPAARQTQCAASTAAL